MIWSDQANAFQAFSQQKINCNPSQYVPGTLDPFLTYLSALIFVNQRLGTYRSWTRKMCFLSTPYLKLPAQAAFLCQLTFRNFWLKSIF